MTGKSFSLKRARSTSIGKLWPIFLFMIVSVTVATALTFDKFQTVNAAAPVVNSISPDNGPIAGGTKITVMGSGFWGEYEQVEYIYFDGESYIQTDVMSRSSGVLKNMNVRVRTATFDKARFIAGAANSSGQQAFAVERYLAGQFRFYASNTGTASGTPGGGTTALGSIPTAGMVDIAFDSVRTFHINGSMYATAVGSTPTADAPYQIGGTNGYTNNTNMNYFKGEFYTMRLTDGTTGELLNNLVPARKKGTEDYGVVDLVTGSFYGNSGSGTITGGPAVPGAPAPDRPISVTIDGRSCTGVEIVNDTELTCHTPSGLSLGQKDVIVSNSINPSETTTIVDGYEYALRLNSVTPKSGDPSETTKIEIDGGVFSTPPDSFVSASVSGIQFDGDSWIETGFDQIGSTSYAIDFKLANAAAALNTGFMGSRSTGSSGSFLVWQLSGSNFRFDYGSSSGVNSSYTGILGVRSNIIIDDGYARLNNIRVTDRAKMSFASELPAQMLLGSLTTGSGYGTNSFAAYKNYGGVTYSAQICKQRSVAESLGVIYQESSLCDPPGTYSSTENPLGTSYSYAERNDRVLVRDLQAAIRTSDNVCGFYDMVTGEFLTNAGYGTLTCTADDTSNTLEVPVDIQVTFSYTDDNDQEQTGICADAGQVVDEVTGERSPTRISCTMPTSPLPGDGQGKVDLTVYANEVKATPGTADADDFYYGSPMVVESIDPNRGSISGGQVVTILGNNFFPDDDDNDLSTEYDPATYDPITSWTDIEVLIGGSPCTFRTNGSGNLLYPADYTNTSITCVTGGNSGGISDIEVTSSYDYIDPVEGPSTVEKYYLYGGSIDPITGAITSGYLYEDDLLYIMPTEGPTTGGTEVTIYGNNFLTSGTSTRVYFGTALATNVTVVNSGTITARTSAHAPGVVDVLVIQDGYAASLSREAVGAFEYLLEISTSALSPNRGYISGHETVRIAGSFDTNPAADTSVTFGGEAVTSLLVADDYIEVTTPSMAAAGAVDVVITQWSTPITMEKAFTYINPLTITSISPDRGPVTGGTIVTITGESFIPVGTTAAAVIATGNLSVTIDGVPCAVSSAANYTNTSIKCTTGVHPSGGISDVTITVDTDANPLTPPNPNHTDTMAGVQNPTTHAVESGFLYIQLSLSISAQPIEIAVEPSSQGVKDVAVSVTTDNPEGYALVMRADDSNSSTANDNQLKCNKSGSTARFEPVSSDGSALSDNTWGWNLDSGNSTVPTTWRKVTTDNTEIDNSPLPSGPLHDGSSADSYKIWFGVKASGAQPVCVYSATVVFTAVANS